MKILFSILFAFLFTLISLSQGVEAGKLQFGFYLEANQMVLQNQNNNSTYRVEAKSSFGMGLGLNLEYQFTKRFSIVTLGGISLSNTFMNLYYMNSEGADKRIYNQNIDIRLHSKFTFGKKSTKPYLFFGPSLISFKIPLLKI